MKLWMIAAIALGLSIDDYVESPIRGFVTMVVIFGTLFLINFIYLRYLKKRKRLD